MIRMPATVRYLYILPKPSKFKSVHACYRIRLVRAVDVGAVDARAGQVSELEFQLLC